MFRQTIRMVPLALVLLTVFNCEESVAARLIKVRVYVDGRVILRGSTSDDGSLDADEVWRLFEEGVKKKAKHVMLSETEYFDASALKPQPDPSNKNRFYLRAPRQRDRWAPITVSVSYGGEVRVRELILYRISPSDDDSQRAKRSRLGPKKWMFDAKQIGELFSARLISREQAARLTNPKQLE